jgi:hypothetical protein
MDNQWRDACVEYVDSGDDTTIQRMVVEFRQETDHRQKAETLRAEQRGVVVELYRQMLSKRVATGLKAAEHVTHAPDGVRKANRYDPMDEESRKWFDAHVQTPIGYGRYLPRTVACNNRYCGQVGKWRHGDGVLWCEKHSKEQLAMEAARLTSPGYAARWAELDLPNGGWIDSSTIIKAAK